MLPIIKYQTNYHLKLICNILIISNLKIKSSFIIKNNEKTYKKITQNQSSKRWAAIFFLILLAKIEPCKQLI